MRLLVCGDRQWVDPVPIQEFYKRHTEIEVVIEGECVGADRMARTLANILDIPTLRFPADWRRHGKAAGVIRNQQMLDEGRPTTVLACHYDIKNSKGTKDMIQRALTQLIPVVLTTGVNYYPTRARYQFFYEPSDFEEFLASINLQL